MTGGCKCAECVDNARRCSANQLRRTELRRKTELRRSASSLRSSSLSPVSRKRAAQTRTYTKRRRLFLEAWPQCQFPDGCQQPATTIQHLCGRRGERLNDETYWAASCWPHNAWAEDHTGEALAMGWLIRIEGAA